MNKREIASAKRLFEAGQNNAYIKGRQEGIKEVVEFIEKQGLHKPYDGSLTQFTPFYEINRNEWQVKIKEWEV